ncbi:12580_t:CDS:1 [Acaulospora morrowiae]|uniref:12580_t:CDS:1 n=1 Tax=Acaulospora morrowiae TaxID=94023 RepID=A0A9N9AP23_9GLOM|nr:12580_t:CDS:1 [Acaulospora morrowiae]
MEAIENALGLDFDFFPAINNNDSETLNKYQADLATRHKACYVSHYRVYESIVRNGYNSALILEDDTDFEISISSIISDIHRILPNDWEMLYIGHCSWEKGGPLIGYASDFKLFKSTAPACTHAYAVTLSGAKKLLKELVNLKLPIDLELGEKIKSGNITSYSLDPPAIVQWKSKDNPSDVSPGAEMLTTRLKNSTLHSLGFQEI